MCKFNALFGTSLNLYVINSLGYLLYFVYFILLIIGRSDLVLNVVNVLQLSVFMGYFYWLASSASKLEGRSKEFCIRVKYFWLGDDTICGVVVTSINGSNYQSDDTVKSKVFKC